MSLPGRRKRIFVVIDLKDGGDVDTFDAPEEVHVFIQAQPTDVRNLLGVVEYRNGRRHGLPVLGGAFR